MITQQQAVKNCSTCNAAHHNNLHRFIRCGLCVATPAGNTKWQPVAAPQPQQEQSNG